MTTILRLNGADFNNPYLPKFVPLPQSGLVAAYTFDGGRINILKGVAPTIFGDPAYDSSGIVLENGAKIITPYKDNEFTDSTLIFIGKRLTTTEPNIYFLGTFPGGTMIYCQEGKGKVYSKDLDGTTVQPSDILYDTSATEMLVATKNKNGNELMIPRTGQSSRAPAITELTTIDDFIRIGAKSNTNDENSCNCSAAILYNRILSSAEITEVYAQMKSHLASSGIEI